MLPTIDEENRFTYDKERKNMLMDITLKITPKMLADAQENKKKELVGHLGTHFDVMNQEFPLEYTKRKGIIFDVSQQCDREIEVTDIAMENVEKDMFVVFYTGYSDREEYGSKKYFSEHPQLSKELIEALVEKKISMIGLDFGGVRRGAEHIPTDQYCADRGVFIIENLCNLKAVLEKNSTCIMHTYPMNCTGITGMPCRVIVEV